MFSRRKGQYFEIDALIAIAILVSGLIYVKTINIEPGSFDRTQMYDRNAIKLLRTKQVGDLPINYIIALENGSLAAFTDRDFSIA
ncbi:hypothetical protein GOV09_06865, partial [Candidatus Woesearchaeota archaeon]|nr:hypothetical protein [Candidatus Woesearchaeota archaeon]